MLTERQRAKSGFRFNTEDTVEGMKASILNHLKFTLARHTGFAGKRDWWMSTCMAVRDRILERMMATQELHRETTSAGSTTFHWNT